MSDLESMSLLKIEFQGDASQMYPIEFRRSHDGMVKVYMDGYDAYHGATLTLVDQERLVAWLEDTPQ